MYCIAISQLFKYSNCWKLHISSQTAALIPTWNSFVCSYNLPNKRLQADIMLDFWQVPKDQHLRTFRTNYDIWGICMYNLHPTREHLAHSLYNYMIGVCAIPSHSFQICFKGCCKEPANLTSLNLLIKLLGFSQKLPIQNTAVQGLFSRLHIFTKDYICYSIFIIYQVLFC